MSPGEALPKRIPDLRDFWEEVTQSSPRTWRNVCLIGVVVSALGIPSDLQAFQGAARPVALFCRGLFFFYFLSNAWIAWRYPHWVSRHWRILLPLMLYVVGIPIGVMGALLEDPANLYFMGVVEVEFAAATFFTIPQRTFLWGMTSINLFYLAAQVFRHGDPFHARFLELAITLGIFAILAGYAQYALLPSRIENWRQREDLRQSQEEISRILSRITDAVFALDWSWRFTYFNQAAERLLSIMNRRKEDLLGRNIWEEFPGLMDSAMRREFLRARQKGTPVNFEEYYPLLGAYMEVHAYPAPEGLSVYLHDISARKAAEQALRRSHEDLERRVAERTAELQQLAAHLQAVREEERSRIAREIHDQLGQTLTALKLDLSWVQQSLNGASPEVQERLRIMTRMVDETVHNVRQIISELRPGILDDLGLPAAVEWLAEQFQQRSGIACFCHIEPEEMPLDPHRAIALFRIIQEALTNVLRHAGATEVHIFLILEGEEVFLEVRDNGRGMPRGVASGKGWGLIGMRERVRQFSGDLTIQSAPGEGTAVVVRLPLATGKPHAQDDSRVSGR